MGIDRPLGVALPLGKWVEPGIGKAWPQIPPDFSHLGLSGNVLREPLLRNRSRRGQPLGDNGAPALTTSEEPFAGQLTVCGRDGVSGDTERLRQLPARR